MNHQPDDDIFGLHAEFCKVIANATRLKIVSVLRHGELSVGRLAKATGASLANVSQHLRILRDHSVLRARKEGRTVYYRLRDPRLVEACELTRNILMGGMRERGALARRSSTGRSPIGSRLESGAPGSSQRLRSAQPSRAARSHHKSNTRQEKQK
jgi:DNA-binding transcriptional ArsR family regulator